MLKSWKILAFYLVCCFVKIELAEAQPKVNFEHFSTADGLSDNRIMCLMKDREGFMWMGSWTGINRFDGHHFVTYKSRPGDHSVLKNNRIDFIIEDHAGFLWLKGYDRQVYRFDKKTEQFLSLAEHTRGGNKTTSNIDKIYESHANHLAKGSIKIKHYYDDDVADAVRRTNRVVLKIHGTIDTPANRRAMPTADPSRWARPDSIAQTLTFLASDAASQTNGALIPVG